MLSANQEKEQELAEMVRQGTGWQRFVLAKRLHATRRSLLVASI